MNNGFSKILLAFDGSEDSVTALKKAKKLSTLCEASLTVVYVDNGHFSQEVSLASGLTNATFQPAFPLTGATHIPITSPVTYDHAQPEIIDNTAEQILSDAKVHLSNALTDVDFEILIGQPANEICNYAKENNIDLIVVGNRGISGIKKWVMGSVSDKVTHLSECPVLVVK